MTKFTRLDAGNLPKPNTLVWCKRGARGVVHLATRQDKPMADEGSNPWDECCWYGFEQSNGTYSTDGRDVAHQTNFSDLTVISWAYVEAPKSEVNND